MPTHYRDPILVCDTCGATTPRPAPGDKNAKAAFGHPGGWTGIGNPHEKPLRIAPRTQIWACGNCPPVYALD